ncbi:MAG: rRNA maturation RNase YbeY [Leptolyngbyaceae cyanobacterium bins.349]|nr:rRNA maturation RNase YbeY [Leptolyngbyaceae cyanobacterium bins.349]
MGIQVEVCVQDCFSEATSAATQDGSDAAQAAIAAISSAQWERWFQQWLEQLQPTLSPLQAYELSLRLTGDRDIQALNAQYRHQDQPTDVLAFAALEVATPDTDEAAALPLYLGDIIISVETAQGQAAAQGHDLRTELAWLASHGLLHLLGWDHPDEASLTQMLTQQKALLNTVGVSSRGS